MKIIIETTSKQTSIVVIDEVNPPQQVARAGGKDLRSAVEYLQNNQRSLIERVLTSLASTEVHVSFRVVEGLPLQ